MRREDQIDFGTISGQERAAHRALNERVAAQGLIEGQEGERIAAEKAAAADKRNADIEKMAREIVTLEDEIAALQGIIDGEERNAKERQKASQGGPAAQIYEESIALREREIENFRSQLSKEEASLDIDELRHLMGAKQTALVDAKEFRDGLLNA